MSARLSRAGIGDVDGGRDALVPNPKMVAFWSIFSPEITIFCESTPYVPLKGKLRLKLDAWFWLWDLLCEL